MDFVPAEIFSPHRSIPRKHSDKFWMGKMKGKINISREFCKGCELCMAFCPPKIISLSEELNSSGYLTAVCTDSEECTGCAVCATVCPEAAIEVFRG